MVQAGSRRSRARCTRRGPHGGDAHLQVQGPKAREVLGPITEGADVSSLRYFRFVGEGSRRRCAGTLSRTGIPAGSASSCLRSEDAERVVGRERGQPHGLRPIGLSAIETLRIESGLLFPDVDYFPHQTDPFEVRLDNVIKLDKTGDFIGRDALREIAAQGTPRLLTTLRIEGDEVPEYGAAVTVDGQDVGIVRSPCQSPTFDMQVIGMAAIDRGLVPRWPACRRGARRRNGRRHGGAVPPLRHREAPAAQLGSGPGLVPARGYACLAAHSRSGSSEKAVPSIPACRSPISANRPGPWRS